MSAKWMNALKWAVAVLFPFNVAYAIYWLITIFSEGFLPPNLILLAISTYASLIAYPEFKEKVDDFANG